MYFRCLYLSAVLHVPLAADRPGIQEIPAAALTVCRVEMERSVTRLVAPYMLCLFVYYQISIQSRWPIFKNRGMMNNLSQM